MSDQLAQWHVFEYEGFEIHVLPQLYENPEPLPHRAGARYVDIVTADPLVLRARLLQLTVRLR